MLYAVFRSLEERQDIHETNIINKSLPNESERAISFQLLTVSFGLENQSCSLISCQFPAMPLISQLEDAGIPYSFLPMNDCNLQIHLKLTFW